ncbi:MAG TPA: hypothetical protein VKX39_14365 [Bryobacteraceae bacterium]|jgi:hypothetical protein|nr:hypothetical protein [Bryobacteraceae bacterium]
MRLSCLLLCVTLGPAAIPVAAQDPSSEAWQLEVKGDAAEARARLERAVRENSQSIDALRAYAEFLDRHRDPAARPAYAKVEAALERGNAPRAERAAIARRQVLLDLIAGDRSAAEKHLAAYNAAGGSGLALDNPPARPIENYVQIPGPLRSFARMAALSPDLNPQDLLGALARNVVTNGYQAGSSNEALDQTEYLKLVVRYLSQARELERLSGDSKIIKIETCDSTQTGDLLRVLGYRMRGGCGSEVVLETVNASRAFLTIDSGFPLAELEQALRTNRPFTLDYHPTRVPVLYSADYWQPAKDKASGPFIDYFISDPSVCRLYLALSKLEPETADTLRAEIPAARLKIYAHVIDFFGAMFEIRNGRAVVPGGARSEKAWAELAGASPEKGAAFFEKLVARDDGWLASYFDALARLNGPVKTYLTEPDRLKRFYAAIRGRVTSPGPARPVFRSNTDMLLLTTRLRLDPDGKPHLPGGLDVWKSLFVNHPLGKYDAKLTRSAPNWKEADDVLEALFALCRKTVENEPLKIFMALSDVERNRSKPLETATVDRLARDFRVMNAQYSLFAEAPSLSDRTILQFLDTARALNQMHDPGMKADAAGAMQSLVSLWQIFVRQGSIAEADADQTLSRILAPFAKIQGDRDIFDAGRGGVELLLTASHSPEKLSPQDRMMDLLAGSATQDDSDAHQQIVEDMIRIFEAQKLISLNTLFDLADNLESVARGQKLNTALAGKLATRISEIDLPRNTMTAVERNSMSFGYYTDRHIEAERKLNLRAAIEHAANDPQKLKDLRGWLTPFLRDTLVGFNYIHYAPPAAQVLRTNALFVRSHDFIGIAGSNQTWKATEVFGTGWPANAGGRLIGSLASLPYALAEAEQNFLIPSREQALIWGDLVPQMILCAVIPRWWNVTPVQLHWVGLHMAYAETLLAESALDPRRRSEVIAAIEPYAAPARVETIERLLAAGDVKGALDNVVPAEMYWLAADMVGRDQDSPLAADIRKLAAQSPDQLSDRAISRAFGTPKPTLANSYEPELLKLRTFPTLMGYSSRILAESWQSNILYYAALADETHVRPAELNVLIPQWTEETVERIFATHLEDWPALLRSLRLVGDEVRQKTRRQMLADASVN